MSKKPVGKLEIRQLDAEVELDKRTHLPIEVSSKCPGCGKQVTMDLSDDHYLAYPVINAPQRLGFYHDCDGKTTEWEHRIVVRLTLEEAHDDEVNEEVDE